MFGGPVWLMIQRVKKRRLETEGFENLPDRFHMSGPCHIMLDDSCHYK